MLEALKLTDGDLNRLHADRAAGLGSFDVALIDAFLKADGNNRAKLAYMFPWLMRGNCFNFGTDRIVDRTFSRPGIEIEYSVLFSIAIEIHNWLDDMSVTCDSHNEFIRNLPSEIRVKSIRLDKID